MGGREAPVSLPHALYPPQTNTVHLIVAQAVKPAEPRFISAFLAALDQG
jgi:hypothetical protein